MTKAGEFIAGFLVARLLELSCVLNPCSGTAPLHIRHKDDLVPFAASRALFLGPRFVDHHFAALRLHLIQSAYGSTPFRVIRHFDKAETLAAVGHTIHDDAGAVYLAMRFEHVAKIVFGGGVGQIAYVNVYHCLILSGLGDGAPSCHLLTYRQAEKGPVSQNLPVTQACDELRVERRLSHAVAE